MFNLHRRAFARTVLAAALSSTALLAHAQALAWPTKPITLVVGFAPGGSADILARTLSQKLSGALGQPVVVDNKPGAGTVIGVDMAAKAPADGHTLLTVANSFCVNQTLVKNCPTTACATCAPWR